MTRLERLVLAALTVYRLARMFAGEDGPLFVFRDARRAVGRWAAPITGDKLNDAARLSVAELVHCPYCLAVWLAGLAAILVVWPSRLGDFALLVFGLAGAQVALQDRR